MHGSVRLPNPDGACTCILTWSSKTCLLFQVTGEQSFKLPGEGEAGREDRTMDGANTEA